MEGEHWVSVGGAVHQDMGSHTQCYSRSKTGVLKPRRGHGKVMTRSGRKGKAGVNLTGLLKVKTGS